jgi:hypothetical protein
MKVAFVFSIATPVSVAVATAPAFSAVLSARVSTAISDAEYLGLKKYLIGFLRAALIPANHCKIFSTVPPHDRNYVTSGSNSIRNQRLVVGDFDCDGKSE